MARLDLRGLVRDAVARARPRARLVGGQLRGRFSGDELVVVADPDHVGKIIDNLINNALTYTADKPWVRVAVSPGPPSEITVTDRGLGIPAVHREKVFERFYRVDHAELPRQAGTGLGLAISRELAERHGGSLELLHTDIGTSFRLRLPPLPDDEGGGNQGNRRD